MKTPETRAHHAPAPATAAARPITGTKEGAHFEYSCKFVDGTAWGDEDPMKLSLEGSHVELNGSKGDLDTSYKPRYNKNFVRFSGIQDTSGESYQIELLVEKRLLEGAPSGTIKMQARGESFFASTYHATRS